MTHFNRDEDICVWLTEEFPLDNNIQTDEEISDDKNIDFELSRILFYLISTKLPNLLTN